MSPSTRSPRAEGVGPGTVRARAAVAIALLAFAAAAFGNVEAPPLPSSVTSLAPSLKPQGGGELRFFGLSIYDGYFWSPTRSWTGSAPYALDLHYHRKLDGVAIAERSVEEIAKLGTGTPAQRQRWGDAMRRIFPDIGKGDRLTGLHLPDGTARFFHNGRAIGEIDDPGFAQAFFGIWLDPRTSRADFRRKLLGE